MKKEFEINNKKQNKVLKKLKKAMRGIGLGVALFAGGFAFQPVLSNFLPASLWDLEIVYELRVLATVAAITLGPIVSIYNGIKSIKLNKELNELKKDAVEMVADLEEENEKLKDKVSLLRKTNINEEKKSNEKTEVMVANNNYSNDIDYNEKEQTKGRSR